MQVTNGRQFVGAMRAQTFLNTFMKLKEDCGIIPLPDFSNVPSKALVPDMCKAFVSGRYRFAQCHLKLC